MTEISPFVGTPTDPLGETLNQLRLKRTYYCQSTLEGKWGLDIPAMTGGIIFHMVTSGQCWMHIEGRKPVHLKSGSLVLLPHGQGHYLYREDGAEIIPLMSLDFDAVTDRFEYLNYKVDQAVEDQEDGQVTQLFCGIIQVDHVAAERLTSQLPNFLMMDGWDPVTDSWLHSTLSLITQEAKRIRLGSETILTNLADIMVLQVLRDWFENAPEAQQGWLAAMRDPHVGRALMLVHQNPGRPWTVDSLAREAGMSRSGFSAKFTELVGNTVKNYVTHWRMMVAKKRLSEGYVTIGQLSDELGYASEAAFSRAFKRINGNPPGQSRRLA